jgi:penicillin-binding protein 1B
MFEDSQTKIHIFLERSEIFLRNALAKRWVQVSLGVMAVPVLIGAVAGGYYYHRYANLIDSRLRSGAFPNSLSIYAGPLVMTTGDGLNSAELATELRLAGYLPRSGGESGSFRLTSGGVEFFPEKSTGHGAVRILVDKDQISTISVADTRGSGWSSVGEYSFGTPLISNVSPNREKRQMVTFSQIPKHLVDAVVAIEDRHFFRHSGVDIFRAVKAAWIDLRDGRKEQGASTLTMQLVRGLWLEPEKKWKRKAAETMMTVHLERVWSKEKIFETYANQIYLGRSGSYAVHGFGQGARALFGKELREINLPEAALLAGIVQRPSYFNPFRYRERATDRRNLVLNAMEQTGAITAPERDAAMSAGLGLVKQGLDEPGDAPWVTDLVNQEMQDRRAAEESGQDVYTTLDLNLQQAADEALATGLAQIDKLVEARNAGGKGEARPPVQAALIAIDPHTGEIKALSGGRNYSKSQLDRILARRPPGSVFKPFVYAAALSSAVESGNNIQTPATTVSDIPTTFQFGGRPYQPSNYHQEFHGTVSLRYAMAHSLNVAAVKTAQRVGYDRVVSLARLAGMNDDIKATPAVALGAYDATPLEIAGAYTIFGNQGMYAKPVLVSEVRDGSGQVVMRERRESHQALDPRVAYLMVSMLQEVMRTGTAAGVRGLGFMLPAAGKTGTSHDGWFAGFTSKLLCVVWVGYDDYRELKLEGAHSALPIWTTFMKKASGFGAYRDAKEFPVPAGVAQVRICAESGKLPGEYCPNVRNEYFVDGSQPGDKCELHEFPLPPAVDVISGFQTFNAAVNVVLPPAVAQP